MNTKKKSHTNSTPKGDRAEISMTALENTTSKLPGAILPNHLSPSRPFIQNSLMNLPKEFKMLHLLPHMIRDKARGNSRVKAIKLIKQNITNGKRQISEKDLADFAAEAQKLGIGKIGYTDVPRELIFQDKGIVYDKAIICVMEMDEDKIAKAPGVETVSAVIDVYGRLGNAINDLTAFLRKRGYEAQAGNPLKGLVLFPPLAVRAGMGWMGKHGLLLTPEFGPRQRIAAIFIGVDNLPTFTGENPHKWISDFCKKCGRCAKMCPGQAILNEPIVHESGRRTCIDNSKCFPQFYDKLGCAVCIKECAFNNKGYSKIYESYAKMQNLNNK